MPCHRLFRLSLLFLFSVAVVQSAQPALFYVSTKGNDAWSGRSASPGRTAGEGPFATLQHARDEIRKLKAAGKLDRGATVQVRGGIYELSETFQLGPEDSGTAQAPIVYKAYPGEKPLLLGGKIINHFEPYQGKILKTDIRIQGFGNRRFRQLICNDQRQPLARYPNFDPQNPYEGGWAYVDGEPIPMYTDSPADTKRSFIYKKSDARGWVHPEDGEVFIFPRYNYWNNLVRIQSVDAATRAITLAGDTTYAIRPTDRYYIQGLFEELDAPGEWYLDPRSGTLYFWPPTGTNPQRMIVYAPTLDTIVQLNPGCSHLTLRGFNLECSEEQAVLLRDCSDCLIAANTIRNVGYYDGDGIVVTGGFRNGVVGNDLSEVGRDAISLTGGDRITLTPGDSYADNNYIHHTGIYYKWGCGIHLTGCGLRASHNLIHDCPRAAIQFEGNNLVMEYNEMRHLAVESEDAAGIGTGGRDWISSRGSVIRYNFIHDVFGYGRVNGRWVTPYFSWGIYLDDNTGGVDVIGNIVIRCGRAGLHLHNARDTVVENNIFVDNTLYQIECNGWTASHTFWTRHLPTMIKGYESVINQPAWQHMRGMQLRPQDAPLPNGLIMAGNIFRHNIVASHDPAAQLYKVRNVDFAHNLWDNNLLWQYSRPLMIQIMHDKQPSAETWSGWQQRGEDLHSVVADPLFTDAARDDYRLKAGSPALAVGFKPIPVASIGPYQSPLRASWPIVEAEGVREHPLPTTPLPAVPSS